jgi:hypothetical protein
MRQTVSKRLTGSLPWPRAFVSGGVAIVALSTLWLVACDSGQQAAAVILTDLDPRRERLPQELQILVCGMTRATVRLEILCNAANSWVSDRLLATGWG